MKTLKRIFTALLILLTFSLYLPNITFAGQAITEHPLKIRSTLEEDISTIKAKKTSAWTWLLAIGLVAGLAAAAGGGGGGGGGGSTPTPTPDKGDITVTW